MVEVVSGTEEEEEAKGKEGWKQYGGVFGQEIHLNGSVVHGWRLELFVRSVIISNSFELKLIFKQYQNISYIW